MIDLRALGDIAVTASGRDVAIGGPRQRRLLAMLLIHRNTVVSSDRLIDAVFAGEPTPGAATTLRSYVARIRRVIESDPSIELETRSPGYRLVVPDDQFDVGRFESRIGAARHGLSGVDVSHAGDLLRSALDQWHGSPYAEFADEEWAQPEAQRLTELRLVAYELYFEAELALGRSGEAVAELELLHAEHPLRDGFTERLMVALYRSGRQVEALRVFDGYRRLLADELGLDPSPTLLAVEQRILQHDPGLLESEMAGQGLRGYRLSERLGLGADGAVVAARVPGLKRDLVMRVVGPDVADDPDFIRSFEARIRRIAGIRSPGLVPIHDYWREAGVAYVVIERMRGGSLADRLRTAPLDADEIRRLVERVGGALDEAAAEGVVHGRVSARNVLFDEHGTPFLTDFALIESAGMSPTGDVAAFAELVAAAADDGALESIAPSVQRVRAGELESMAQVVEALLAGLELESAPAAAPVNPYKGLQAFDEADAADYFGRDEIVADILRRLDSGDGTSGRLVMVVGGSGTGKSSLVRAGLLPRIRAGEVSGSASWFVSTMLPGATPFKELAESIGRVAVAQAPTVDDLAERPDGIDVALSRALADDGQLLLVIDQFEELFTLTPEAERGAFLTALLAAVTSERSRLRVVATLRGDFYDRPLDVPGLGAVVGRSTVAMAAMTAADVEAAIVRPARRVGRSVEGPLVAELVSAGGTDAAALPALQFALYELAERCGETLTLDAYREIGGIEGAIAERAESLFQAHTEDQAEIRRMFERLVVIAVDGDVTRRPAIRAELTRGPDGRDVDGIVERWAEARMLTVDRDPRSRLPTVEVAHEALLRQWPRLRGWLDDDRSALLLLGQVRDGAAEWAALDRDDGMLLRGARLDALDQVLATRDPHLSGIEQEYVDASHASRDAEEREAADRLAAQVTTNRRLRRRLVGLGVALVLALGGGVFALVQREATEKERRVATARELAAAANASVEDDAERATLLALEAVAATGGGDDALPEAVEALHRAVTSSRLLLSAPGVGGALAWSGSVFVTEGPEASGVIDIRDATTGESLRSWKGHDIDVNDVALDPDGTLVASAGDDGALRVWDVATGELRHEFDAAADTSVWAPTFSRDGARVAASWDGRIRVFELGLDDPIAVFDAPIATRASFDATGSRLAWSRADGPVATIGDIDTGEILLTVGEEERWINDVAFSPDGERLATSGGDGVARIWDAATGSLLVTVVGHNGPVGAVAWGPGGTTLATGSDDGTARLWDVTGGVARELVQVAGSGTRAGVADIALSPDGERLMTGDWAVSATEIWDIGPLAGAEWANMASRPESRADLVFVGDDVAASVGRTVRLWDASTGSIVADIGADSAGTLPDDPDASASEITDAMTTLYDGSVPITDRLGFLDDPTGVTEALASATVPQVVAELASSRVSINRIEFIAGDEARLRYDLFGAAESLPGRVGVAVLTPEGWQITRDTFCADLAMLELDCGEGDTARRGAVDRVAASTDGRLLATSNGMYPVDIWDVDTGRLLTTVTAPEPEVAVIDMEWSPDGEHLAVIAGGEGCWVSIVDLSGVEVDRFEDPDTCLKSVAYSADGRLVAATRWPDRVGAGLGGVHVWDATTGELRFTTDADADWVAFDPDGQIVAATSQLSSTIDLWDVESGELVRSLESNAPSTSVEFDPRGTTLASGGLDGGVRIWRIADGTISSVLDAGAAAIRSVAYDADGTRLASVDDDGIVRVWALEVDDLVGLAEERVTRPLTDAECRQYLHSDVCA